MVFSHVKPGDMSDLASLPLCYDCLKYNHPVQRLWAIDQEIFRTIHHSWHQNWLDPVFWVISSSGLGWVQILMVLLVWYAQRIKVLSDQEGGSALSWSYRGFKGFRFQEWRNWVWPLILCYAGSGILNSAILKKLIERDRPSRLADSLPQETFYYNAFPSGHTASAFAIGFYIFLRFYGTEKAKWGQLAMLWSCLVGVSRIYRGVHWPTDVLGGACVGMIVGALIYLWLDTEKVRDAEGQPPTEA